MHAHRHWHRLKCPKKRAHELFKGSPRIFFYFFFLSFSGFLDVIKLGTPIILQLVTYISTHTVCVLVIYFYGPHRHKHGERERDRERERQRQTDRQTDRQRMKRKRTKTKKRKKARLGVWRHQRLTWSLTRSPRRQRDLHAGEGKRACVHGSSGLTWLSAAGGPGGEGGGGLKRPGEAPQEAGAAARQSRAALPSSSRTSKTSGSERAGWRTGV